MRKRRVTRNRKRGVFIVSIIMKISFWGEEAREGAQNVIIVNVSESNKNLIIV